jgi:putative membrane protein (TIGR04086 family)
MIGLVLRALLFAIAAMALNVAAAFLWVWFYSFAIAPGHDEAFYQAYAQRAAPISSLVAGAPILLAAGWLSARRFPERALLAGALVGILYAAIDLAILASVAGTVPMWIIITSVVSKIGASALGGLFAGRSRTRPA